MAKAFLLRYGTENDFKSIKLQTRELGVAIDSEKLYLGLEDRNVHVPHEDLVAELISRSLSNYTHPTGTTAELTATQKTGTIAFDTELKRLRYKSQEGAISLVTPIDLPAKDPVSFVVESANIDTDDNNSVSLTGFTRPTRTVFLNGNLCTTQPTDAHRYSFDAETKVLKIYGCQEDDIIAYL